MTAVGIITLIGLVVAFRAVHQHRVMVETEKAWWALFYIFLATNIWHFTASNLSYFVLYAISAAIGIAWLVFVFRSQRYSHALILFMALFVVNTVALAYGLDAHRILTVGALDVCTWLQIALLFRLAKDYPDEILCSPLKTNTNNVLRVIHGMGRAGTGAKA